MRNPLLGSRQQNTSRAPSKTPEAVPPVPEEYEGDNNPYRGTESHGVAAVNKPSPVAGYESTAEGVHYLDEVITDEPIPVRVVQDRGRELRRWQANAFVLTAAGGPVRIATRNLTRTRLRVFNSSVAENAWISNERLDSSGTFAAFKLVPGSVELLAQDDVWCFSDSVAAGGCLIQIIEEYSVPMTAEQRGPGK